MDNTLINFRMPVKLLQELDGICTLMGLTRTQVLRQLIAEHVRDVGEKLPEQVERDRRTGVAIRNAVRRQWKARKAVTTSEGKIAGQTRLKSFSESIKPESL